MYNDYPQSATNAAKRALKHKEKNGSKCGTPVGWTRANQLASRKSLSLDTVKRTFSFLSRAKTYDQGKFTDSDGKEICGSIMYAAWGGDSMRNWCERTINKEENRNFSEMERRYFNTRGVEVDDDEKGVTGYGIVFDVETHLGDDVFEVIERDGYENAGDMIVSFNHNLSQVLGRESSGTAIITVDDTGVRYDVPELPNTSYANDMKESMKRKDVTGSSFMFEMLDYEWKQQNGGDKYVRHVTKYRVHEMGPVTLPAYNQTNAVLKSALRSRNSFIERQQQEEEEAKPELKDYSERFRQLRFKEYEAEMNK